MHTTAKYFQAVCYWLAYGLLRIFAHFKIEEQENLKGLEEIGVIFAANHRKWMDPGVGAVALPRDTGEFYPKKFFPVRFLAHARFFKLRYLLIALYVWINGSIPVCRGKKTTDEGLKNILAEAVKALRNKEKVWIFPEGKVSKDGSLGKGKRGVAYLHKITGAPIVPVAILGTDKLHSPAVLLGRIRVTVRFGKPIYSLKADNLFEASQEVMAAIAELMR